MNIEQSLLSKKATTSPGSGWSDLPPAQAGLAAALRRAFDLPADGNDRAFADLLGCLR